jgi:hypothetical protein
MKWKNQTGSQKKWAKKRSALLKETEGSTGSLAVNPAGTSDGDSNVYSQYMTEWLEVFHHEQSKR